jgi:hypothetical protein
MTLAPLYVFRLIIAAYTWNGGAFHALTIQTACCRMFVPSCFTSHSAT